MTSPQLNGQQKWMVWLAGVIMTILLTTITMLSSGVIVNERNRVSSEKEIIILQGRVTERISRLEECVMGMKSDIEIIRSDVKDIRKAVMGR